MSSACRGAAYSRGRVALQPAIAVALLTGAALDAQAIEVINVEMDWLTAGDHDHRPTECEVGGVFASFAANEIYLRVEWSDSIAETPANADLLDMDFDDGEWAQIESANRDHAVGTGWHYGLFGHQYNSGGSSGLAEFGQDEFLVSLGTFNGGGGGSPIQVAGTLMHELGHNLGFTHAGDQDPALHGTHQPNYPSIMSYRYQLGGVASELECQDLDSSPSWARELDYSHGTLADLDENFGIGSGPVNWDCFPGLSNPVAMNISDNEGPCGLITGDKTVLEDHDDWSNIEYLTHGVPSPGSGPSSSAPLAQPEVVSCMTSDDSPVVAFGAGCGNPNPCGLQPGEVWADLDGSNTFQFGAFSTPYKSFAAIQALAPDGSRVLIKSSSSSETLTITKPMTIFPFAGPVTIGQ